MKNFLMMLLLAFSLSTVAIGCADEVNAETDDINTDNDDDADEGAAGMSGDPEPEPVDDVDECVAACDDDSCAAACRE